MANKIIYQIVGRYMDGKEVTGYHLQSIDADKSSRYTKEQVYFLVGKGQISNCSGQIYQDKVLLRGIGVSLEDLPIQREDGTLSRTDNIGKVRRGTSVQDAMNQFMLVQAITDGRNTIGYVVANAGGATKNVARQQVLELAQKGKIGNARYQESNGKPILRGVNINLNELPTVTAESLGLVPAKTPVAAQQAAPQAVKSAPKQVASKNNSSLTAKDKEVIAAFKRECTSQFETVNKSALVANKLENQGYMGVNEEDREPDHISLERFDFGVKGGSGALGGFIELLVNSGKYQVEFSYSADSDGDFNTVNYDIGAMKMGLRQSWATAVKEFKRKGAI